MMKLICIPEDESRGISEVGGGYIVSMHPLSPFSDRSGNELND